MTVDVVVVGEVDVGGVINGDVGGEESDDAATVALIVYSQLPPL
jgi:hypothetical protein